MVYFLATAYCFLLKVSCKNRCRCLYFFWSAGKGKYERYCDGNKAEAHGMEMASCKPLMRKVYNRTIMHTFIVLMFIFPGLHHMLPFTHHLHMFTFLLETAFPCMLMAIFIL